MNRKGSTGEHGINLRQSEGSNCGKISFTLTSFALVAWCSSSARLVNVIPLISTHMACTLPLQDVFETMRQ